MKKINELKAERAELIDKMTAISTAENLTEELRSEWAGYDNQIKILPLEVMQDRNILPLEVMYISITLHSGVVQIRLILPLEVVQVSKILPLEVVQGSKILPLEEAIS